MVLKNNTSAHAAVVKANLCAEALFPAAFVAKIPPQEFPGEKD
jgi:hypothetical protein